jgi:hypothetical protein
MPTTGDNQSQASTLPSSTLAFSHIHCSISTPRCGSVSVS